MNSDQYSLILATALISITINPFMYGLMPVMERIIRLVPGFWKRLDSNISFPEPTEEQLKNHAVIIGYGKVGKHLVDVLESLSIPLLVIEADPERVTILGQKNIPTLFGNPGNSELINHAHLEQASVLVTTVPDETTALLIVTAARDINPELPIIARAATAQGVRNLADSAPITLFIPN